MRAWIGQRLIHLFGSAPCVSAPLSETVPFFSCIESALHRCCLPPVSATRNTCRHARDRPCSKAKALISLNSPTNPNPEILTLIANHHRPSSPSSCTGERVGLHANPAYAAELALWRGRMVAQFEQEVRGTKEMDQRDGSQPQSHSTLHFHLSGLERSPAGSQLVHS